MIKSIDEFEDEYEISPKFETIKRKGNGRMPARSYAASARYAKRSRASSKRHKVDGIQNRRRKYPKTIRISAVEAASNGASANDRTAV